MSDRGSRCKKSAPPPTAPPRLRDRSEGGARAGSSRQRVWDARPKMWSGAGSMECAQYLDAFVRLCGEVAQRGTDRDVEALHEDASGAEMSMYVWNARKRGRVPRDYGAPVHLLRVSPGGRAGETQRAGPGRQCAGLRHGEHGAVLHPMQPHEGKHACGRVCEGVRACLERSSRLTRPRNLFCPFFFLFCVCVCVCGWGWGCGCEQSILGPPSIFFSLPSPPHF